MPLVSLILLCGIVVYGQTRIAAVQITDQLRQQLAPPTGRRQPGTWIDVARQVKDGGIVKSAPGRWELYARTYRLTITVPWARTLPSGRPFRLVWVSGTPNFYGWGIEISGTSGWVVVQGDFGYWPELADQIKAMPGPIAYGVQFSEADPILSRCFTPGCRPAGERWFQVP